MWYKCKRKRRLEGKDTHTHTLLGQTKCVSAMTFFKFSVHLRRITGPDGHWMNNATPAEGHSAIRFSQKNSSKNKNFSLHKEIWKEIMSNPNPSKYNEVSYSWSCFNLTYLRGFQPNRFCEIKYCISFTEEIRWACTGVVIGEAANLIDIFLSVSCHTPLEIWLHWP